MRTDTMKQGLYIAISLLGFTGVVYAEKYQVGSAEVTTNLSVSAGVGISMEDPEPKFYHSANGELQPGLAQGSGLTRTTDDGKLNFSEGDVYSSILKANGDVDINFGTYGVFLRGKAWYDNELENGDRPHGHAPNGYESGAPLDDSDFSDFAKFKGAELLDAFLYTEFDIGEVPVSLRVGRQVVSWGEGTLILGGVNSINPIDVNAFRRPGADIKEGLLPVGMIFGQFGLTPNLSLETFYQYEWDSFAIDGCGTFFATTDFAATGCGNGSIPFAADDPTASRAGLFIPRAENVDPDDRGQYGMAMRYYSDELGTEFGAYYMNIHSRRPLISIIRGDADVGAGYGFQDNASYYFIEYPEDQQIIGLSFATEVSGLSLSGEISHHKDEPHQVNGTDLLVSLLTSGGPVGDVFTATPVGGVSHGYGLFDRTRVQMTGIKFLDNVMGASRLTLLGEVGADFSDVPDSDASANGTADPARYGRNPIYGFGDTGGFTDGYMTDFSWGYRVRAIWNYGNVFNGISLKPVLAWSHDVKGYSNAFFEDRKVLGLTLKADYLSKYNASIGYTSFTGDKQIGKDRDFLSLSVGMTF
ncbi:MAG: DUF1302 domain-containing protein, partial [Candidatus Thiodiazotropha endolucinida]